MTKKFIQRFWAKVNKNGPVPLVRSDLGVCWLWMASCGVAGYGQFGNSKKKYRAHRLSYRIIKGRIPRGLDLDHLCRVRKCVNPSHLQPVTRQVNLLRGKTIPACNAAKTHCPKGHKYTKENTYTDLDNCRHCRICKKAAWTRWYERHLA